MQPRRRVIAANKESILREARVIFRKRGFSGTTMDAVAKASDISKSTIYVYFKSKEDLFLHIVLEGLISLRDAVRGLVDSYQSVEAFHSAVCDFIVEVQNREPLFFHGIAGNAMMGESRHAHPNLIQQIDAVREEILMTVVDNFASADYGMVSELAPIARLELGYILWACVYGIISIGEAQALYINERFGKEKRAFMRSGFERLLNLFIHVCDSPTRRCRL